MAVKRIIGREAEIFLGLQIEKLRMLKGFTRAQLAKEVNVKVQQLEEFEKGGFVAMTMLELIADSLGEPIPKRIIRKISNTRKIEIETQIEQKELIAHYTEAFPALLG